MRNAVKTVFSAVPLESETVSQLLRRGIAVKTSNPKAEGQLFTKVFAPNSNHLTEPVDIFFPRCALDILKSRCSDKSKT